MARIMIAEIVDHLGEEMILALKDSLEKAAPQSKVDSRALFIEFKKQVGRRFSSWESVPDYYVETSGL